MSAEMAAKARPILLAAAHKAAQRMIVEEGIGVSWTLVAEKAAQWAAQYSYELVKGITDTTRRVLRESVTQFLREPGRTIGDLTKDLLPYFGRVRAQMIGVTETTRAFTEGEKLTVAQAQLRGWDLEPIWHVCRDILVCPMCKKNDGKAKSEGWTAPWPPAHPRCRCWITHRVGKLMPLIVLEAVA